MVGARVVFTGGGVVIIIARVIFRRPVMAVSVLVLVRVPVIATRTATAEDLILQRMTTVTRCP